MSLAPQVINLGARDHFAHVQTKAKCQKPYSVNGTGFPLLRGFRQPCRHILLIPSGTSRNLGRRLSTPRFHVPKEATASLRDPESLY